MLEIACFSLEAAKIVANTSANRIEFCSNLKEGGLTPNLNDFIELKKISRQPIFVMIRPRGGDFVYSVEEFEQMENEILEFKKYKVDGFVFGILNHDGSIDVPRNKELIDLAEGLPCTLHRAFDRGTSLIQNLEDAIECGFNTILTSGMEKNVELGQQNLKQLIDLANDRINILVGGGLRTSNLPSIKNDTCAMQFHSSAIMPGDVLPSTEEIQCLYQLI